MYIRGLPGIGSRLPKVSRCRSLGWSNPQRWQVIRTMNECNYGSSWRPEKLPNLPDSWTIGNS
jgi:hypothetical protein